MIWTGKKEGSRRDKYRAAVRIYLCLAVSAACMTFARIPVWAAVSSSLEKAEGRVDIMLEEFTLNEEGKEVPWKDLEHVMPGQDIVKIPRITNLASACNIRAKIEVTMGKEVEFPVTLEMLQGMPEGWKLKGDGYYYYEKKLKKGESVELFRSLTIPAQWDTHYGEDGEITPYYTENSLDILVTAEAIGDENGKEVIKTVQSPKTDDAWDTSGYFILAAFSILALCAVLMERRRYRR